MPPTYSKEAIDKLLDELSSNKREIEDLRTQRRNAENVLAALVEQYGNGGHLRLHKSALVTVQRQFTLSFKEEPGGDYTLTVSE